MAEIKKDIKIGVNLDAKSAVSELGKVEDAAKEAGAAVDKLDGSDVNVSVDATDNASEVLDEDAEKVETLDGETATVTTEADDQASDTLDTVADEVHTLDGETATVDAEADDNATDVLDGIHDTADELDGLAPEIVPEVDDSSLDTLDDFKTAAEELDGMAPEITPQVDSSGLDQLARSADNASDSTGNLGTTVALVAGKIGGPAAGALGAVTAGATAGVVGLGAAAVIATQQFGAMALKAQEFATAAGTSTEEAGRWIEVVGDLGGDADTVESALGRMNKNLGSGKISMEEFGLAAGTTSENFINLLRMIGQIPDAAKQAAVGNEVFGKGWQALAPLIINVEELGQRLEDVADIKAPNPEQIKRAEELRDAMDELGDSVEEAALSLGEQLVPSLIEAAKQFTSLIQGTGLLNNEIKDNGNAWDFIKNSLGEITGGTEMARQAQDKQKEATKEQTAEALKSGTQWLLTGQAVMAHAQEVAKAQAVSEEATRQEELANEAHRQAVTDILAHRDALLALDDELNKNELSTVAVESAQIKANQQLREYGTQAKDATVSAEDHTLALNATYTQLLNVSTQTANTAVATSGLTGEVEKNALKVQTQIDYLDAVAKTLAPDDPLRVRLEAYKLELEGIKTDVATKVALDTEEALRKLRELQTYVINIRGGLEGIGGGGLPGFASGGTVPGPTGAPTLAVVHGGEKVIPAVDTGMSSGGAGVTVNVYGGGPGVGKQVVDELTWAMRTGQVAV